MSRIQIKVPDWLDRLCACPVLLYRRLLYDYPYRKIPLGQDKFTIVTPSDFYSLNNFQWYAQQTDRNVYAVRFILNPGQRPKIISMHRDLMNSPKDLLVDHRNCDGLDNHRANLRLATHSQNQCNKRKRRSKTSSRFIGVSLDKGTGRWCAIIKAEGKSKWLGRFVSELDAARAYDNAARKYHKDFARLNFPD
jgi:hypothetical protein